MYNINYFGTTGIWAPRRCERRYKFLLNYPCTTQGASPVVGKVHSSHVMNVRFSHAKGQKAKTEELKIYSVGGNDRAVFQWKLSKV